MATARQNHAQFPGNFPGMTGTRTRMPSRATDFRTTMAFATVLASFALRPSPFDRLRVTKGDEAFAFCGPDCALAIWLMPLRSRPSSLYTFDAVDNPSTSSGSFDKLRMTFLRSSPVRGIAWLGVGTSAP